MNGLLTSLIYNSNLNLNTDLKTEVYKETNSARTTVVVAVVVPEVVRDSTESLDQEKFNLVCAFLCSLLLLDSTTVCPTHYMLFPCIVLSIRLDRIHLALW